MLKVGSFFSGCGGLDLGFKQSGFEVEWANDFDKDACSVYQKNLGDIICEDITKIDEGYLPKIDVLTGGFPCQPFSTAGNRLGVGDDRGNLFFETLRFIKKHKPLAVVFENVRGILSTKNKSGNKLIHDIELILSDIDGEVGYNTNHKLLLASDYDVPQNRYRVFIVGIRKDLNHHYTFPSVRIQNDIEKLTVNNVINYDPSLTDLDVWSFSPQQKTMVEHIPEGGSWKDVPYEILPDRFRKIRDNMKLYRSPNFYRRFARNEINGTITASAQPENCGIIHPLINRRYNVRETARIQSFPDDFVFQLPSVQMNYKVIGNAVPPNMAKAVADSLLNQLTSLV
jgi:DNA (cytosine-5)-methyltransferase 1